MHVNNHNQRLGFIQCKFKQSQTESEILPVISRPLHPPSVTSLIDNGLKLLALHVIQKALLT